MFHIYIYIHIYICFHSCHQTGLDTRSKARRPIKVGINYVGGNNGNELRLEPCWFVLLIEPLSAMWV